MPRTLYVYQRGKWGDHARNCLLQHCQSPQLWPVTGTGPLKHTSTKHKHKPCTGAKCYTLQHVMLLVTLVVHMPLQSCPQLQIKMELFWYGPHLEDLQGGYRVTSW